MPGYETHVLDTSRPIQYNKLTVNQQGDVSATMHRPLRQGKPWAFHGLEGVSADSLEETDEQCVSYQLSKHIKIKGKGAPWTQQQIAEMLIHVTEQLYECDDDILDEEAIERWAAAAADEDDGSHAAKLLKQSEAMLTWLREADDEDSDEDDE